MTGKERLKERESKRGTSASGKEVQGEYTMKDKIKLMDKRVRDRESENRGIRGWIVTSNASVLSQHFTAHPQLTILMVLIFMINSLAPSPLARPLLKCLSICIL